MRLEALELAGDPTQDDIQAAFRRLASERHPDRGGDGPQFARIVDARDVLVRPAAALVPVEQVRDIVIAATGAVEERARRAELREDTQSAIRGAVRVRTTAIRQRQRQLGSLAFTSALMGILSQIGRLEPLKGSGLSDSLGIVFGGIAVLLGLLTAVVNQSKSQIQAHIEEVADLLDNKAVLVETLQRILAAFGPRGMRDRNVSWTSGQWARAVDEWVYDGRRPIRSGYGLLSSLLVRFRDLRMASARRRWEQDMFEMPTGFSNYDSISGRSLSSLARRIGSPEFGRLVLAKAKEREVVVEVEEWVEDRLVVSFSFNKPVPNGRTEPEEAVSARGMSG